MSKSAPSTPSQEPKDASLSARAAESSETTVKHDEAEASANGGRSERTKRELLEAATKEFARHGLHGARVDVIARHANVNKQLIYYYFGGKDALFAAVLERCYADIRNRERALELADLSPQAAMERLVGFTFDYLDENPEFVDILSDENRHRGIHLTDSEVLKDLRSPFVALIAETLSKGQRDGVFRSDVDPTQFYISLAGACFFYMANTFTLSAMFGRDFTDPEERSRRRPHVIAFVMGYLRP